MKKRNTLLLLLFLMANTMIFAHQQRIEKNDDFENQPISQEELTAGYTDEHPARKQKAEMSEETPHVEHLHKNALVSAPDSWILNLDSLINSWHIKYFIEKRENQGYRETILADDAVYVERLSRMNNIIELPYNEVVRNCINLYVDRRRSVVEYMLGLERIYFPIIEQILDEQGLPDELKYLAVVESGLNPVALSRVGASGLWQFMLPTGKQYGLEINSLIDERRDPLKATYAACEYLKDMYHVYGDWTLAIASYNCGPGNVNKAIARANGSRDYWKIYPYLPKETRTYVPLFIAATYAMNYYAHHQLYPAQPRLPLSTDTIVVNQPVHFNQIADVLDVDVELLRALNPQYKKDIVPGNSMPRVIKLPSVKAVAFAEKENEIINHRKDELFANRTYVSKGFSGQERITHRVTKGETLLKIGNNYGVTTAQLRKWNGLRSNRVAAGKKLTIYIDNGGYASVNPSKEKAKTEQTQDSSQSTTALSEKYDTYKVKAGDSLSLIAQKYPGYSSHDLRSINNLKSDKIRVGQLIKVPVK
ncbi:MAG: transglycosylase SLT domain-containing protein [Dysgonamonadaceae bacterium]|jgi:membrane-bound lytic murein transglycosylase D|nr:transglycosylase SLT domain-containing protein [Dysgonamonadaceae bacterium]